MKKDTKWVDRYFKIIETTVGGTFMGPKMWKPYPESDGTDKGEWIEMEWYPIKDTEPFSGIVNGKMLEVDLCSGAYRNYVTSNCWTRIVSPEMKQLLEFYATDLSDVSFYPIMAVSKEFGDRIHYIMQFNRIHKVWNPDCSVYVYADGLKGLTIPGIDKAKAKGLNFFNMNQDSAELYVSDIMRRAIVRHKLNKGISFMELPCEYRSEDAEDFDYEDAYSYHRFNPSR